VKDFRSFYDLLVDMADFTSASKELLQSFPLKMIDFKVDLSQNFHHIVALPWFLLIVEEKSKSDDSLLGPVGDLHARASAA
jgi:hypothetical protein